MKDDMYDRLLSKRVVVQALCDLVSWAGLKKNEMRFTKYIIFLSIFY